MGLGVAAGPVVVPFETRPKVVGDSDVVTRGIAVASKHVDDSLFDVVHAGHHARNGPVRNQTNRRVSRKDGNAGCRRRSASAGCNDALLRRDSLRMLVSSPALGRSDSACLAVAHPKGERRLAPQAGFEPATLRLTAGCSAV